MCRYILVGLALLLISTQLQGTNRDARIYDSKGYVVFHSTGQRAGLTTNGKITFYLHIAPMIDILSRQCNLIRNLPSRQKLHPTIDDSNSRNAIFENCVRKSQSLTHVLTSWMEESELHSHELIKAKSDEMQQNHFSRLAHTQLQSTHLKESNEQRNRRLLKLVTPIPDERMHDAPSTSRYFYPEPIQPTLPAQKPPFRPSLTHNQPQYRARYVPPPKKVHITTKRVPITLKPRTVSKPKAPPKPKPKAPPRPKLPPKPKPSQIPKPRTIKKIPIKPKSPIKTKPEKKAILKPKPKARPKPVQKFEPPRNNRKFQVMPRRKPQIITDFPTIPPSQNHRPKRPRREAKTPPISKYLSRKKRFLSLVLAGAAVGITALAGAAAGLFHHGASVTEVQAIAKDTQSMFMLEEHQIHSLHDNLNLSIQMMEGAETEMQYLLAYDNLKYQTLIIYERIDIVMNGLGKLLHKQLDPNLVHADVLRQAFDDVTLKVKSQGAEPIFSGILDLYSLSVGHELNKTGLSFTISLSIPVQASGRVEALYQYRPFPLHLGHNTNRFVMPILKEHYIGVSHDQDQQHEYATMTLDELMECQTMGSIRVCHRHSFVTHSQDSNCLIALYHFNLQTEAEKILNNCRMDPVYTDHLVQVSDTSFMLLLYQAQVVNLVCHGQDRGGGRHQGIFEVVLPPGCHGRTNEFSFSSESYFAGSNKTVLKGELNLEDLTDKVNLTKFAKLHEQMRIPTGGLTIAQATRQFDEDVANVEQHTWTWYCIWGGAFFIIVLVLYWLITRYFPCLICRSKADRVIFAMQALHKPDESNEFLGSTGNLSQSYPERTRSRTSQVGVPEAFPLTASAPPASDYSQGPAPNTPAPLRNAMSRPNSPANHVD